MSDRDDAQPGRCADGGVPPAIEAPAQAGRRAGEECQDAVEAMHDRLHVGTAARAESKKMGETRPPAVLVGRNCERLNGGVAAA